GDTGRLLLICSHCAHCVTRSRMRGSTTTGCMPGREGVTATLGKGMVGKLAGGVVGTLGKGIVGTPAEGVDGIADIGVVGIPGTSVTGVSGKDIAGTLNCDAPLEGNATDVE